MEAIGALVAVATACQAMGSNVMVSKILNNVICKTLGRPSTACTGWYYTAYRLWEGMAAY